MSKLHCYKGKYAFAKNLRLEREIMDQGIAEHEEYANEYMHEYMPRLQQVILEESDLWANHMEHIKANKELGDKIIQGIK